MDRIVAHWYQRRTEAVTRTLNWAADLNGSTISSVAWTVPSGLTNEAVSNTTTLASIRLSGGTPSVTYLVQCLVTTAASEDLEAQFQLTIS